MVDTIRPITSRTRVRVLTGVNMQAALTTPPAEVVAYNLVSSALSMVEGDSPVKVQVYGSAIKINSVRVPFIVEDPVVGTPAVRGTDYELVDAAGELLAGDYFSVPAGQLRGEIYINPLTDATPADDTSFLLRIVRDNDEAGLGAGSAIGTRNEVLSEILDASAPLVSKISFVDGSSVVVEPDGTDTSTLTLSLALDRASGSPVVATITALSGSAESGVDYTLASGTATIPALDTSGTFEVTILGNDTYQGDRNLRLQISAVSGGEALSGAAEHEITIQDNEVDSSWTVGWDPLHEGTITLLERSSVKAKMVFVEGVANESDVLVYWRFKDRDSSGLVLGSQVTTAATNPITINKGSTFAEITLSGVPDDVVDEDRGFEIELTGVTGGSAELGMDNALLGTLLDTTVELPTVSWLDSELSATEGATVRGYLALSEAQPNPVTVSIARSGTAGVSDLRYQGERDPLVFPIGATSLPVWFTALQDSTIDPGESAVFTIQAASGYTAGTIAAMTVSVNEPISGTSTVEFRPTPGMETLVSACTGFDPTPVTSPPDMMIGGVKCDAFPIDPGRRISDPVGWELVAYGDFPDGTAALEPNDGSASYGTGYATTDISDLEFSLQTYREDGLHFAAHTAKMSDGLLVEVTKDGHYVRDETWLLRPRLASEAGTMHEYCGQVLVFLTRRPDCVKFRCQLMNEGYDPTRAVGHYGSEALRTELDGAIRFTQLTVDTGVANPRVQMDPDSIACTVGAYAIRQAGSHTVDDGFGGFTSKTPPHLFPPQRVFCWDFAVFDSATTEAYQRDYILRGTGEGWVIDGPYAYFMREWFGPNAAPLPEPTTEYSHRDDFTGLEACRQYGQDYLRDCLHVLNGTADMNPQGGASRSGMWYRVGEFGGDQYGWFAPSTWRWNYQHGGEGINMQFGFDMEPNTQRAMWLDSRHKVQADTSGILDITTGLPLTATVAAQYNVGAPGQQGYSPLFGSPNNQNHGFEWHWFLPVAAGGTQVEDQKRPTDRLWSQIPTVTPTTDPLFVFAEPLEVQSSCGPIMDPTDASAGKSLDNYNLVRPDIDHLIRVSAVYKALAWTRNSSWAKYQLRRIASRVEYLFSFIPIRGQASAGETARFNQDMVETGVKLATTTDGGHVPSTDSFNYGGFGVVAEWYGLYRTRGAAHASDVQAAAGAVTSQSAPDYADRKNWWDRYLETSRSGASGFGSFERESGLDRKGNAAGDPATDNHPWSGPAWDPSSYIPKNYGCGQWWKTAWYACRHFSGNKVYGDSSTYAAFIRQFCDTQAFGMFRVAPLGARVAGRTRPMHHIISSGGTWGQEEKPGTLPISWDVLNADGSPKLADTRICQLMVESLRGLDEMGETTLYNELLGYIKVFFGLTEGHSLDALIAELFVEMNRDMRPNQRWAAGYVSDLLGFLQHKNRQ